MNVHVGYYWQLMHCNIKKRGEQKMHKADIIVIDNQIYYRVYYYGTVENILDAIVYGAEFIISNGKLYVANLI